MGFKATISKPLAKWVSHRIREESADPIRYQHEIFRKIIKIGSKTEYGMSHNLPSVCLYDDFKNSIPVIGYEDLKPWIERSAQGIKNVLWPDLPLYFAKTSGTTSGSKYIPITRDSISNHIDSARNALLLYIHKTGNSSFVNNKMIFLQGSPVLEKHGVIDCGRLSGIAAHHVPAYLQRNRLPSWETNCIEDWETKVDHIVDETVTQRLSLISGIPSWLRMYFEKLVEKEGKPVGRIFPDFQLLVYGGVNFEPYRSVFDELIGRTIDTLELFPASEGFFAYQDLYPSEGLLLNINSGIFYEFIPLSQVEEENPERIPLEEVKTGTDYSLIVSSNAGLWGYAIGDTVRFTSLSPYRLVVSGRISQFISAFGEHVIASEIEGAMAQTLAQSDARVAEFTVAPLLTPQEGKPRHEWFVEFEKRPSSVPDFAENLDQALRFRNSYYNDLIKGKVLDKLSITELPRGTFDRYMKERGMLGGQNKVPRLADNRKVADGLTTMAGC